MKVSVVVPMYNEEENAKETISRIVKILSKNYNDWELIAVDDGSTDHTLELANQEASKNPNVRIISYNPNRGRGRALRTGFKHAKGDIVVTLDADLSYDEKYIPILVDELGKQGAIDIIVGSPFLKGGAVKGVKPHRYLLSNYGNKLLGLALPGNLRTITGLLRAYRRYVLDSLDLESDGKEIHLEILSKALALGYRVEEVPAILLARQKGKSKFKLRTTTISHLLFSFFEKPSLLFGFFGLILLILGILTGGYIIYLWQTGELTPFRPLMILMMLLILVGAIVIFFGFISTQIGMLRREIYRIQRDNRQLANNLKAKNKNDS